MNGKRVRKKIADLKRRPMRQSNGTQEELKALALSWLERAAHDIIVCPSLTIVDGHRRIEGLMLLGQTEVDVFVTDEELTESQIKQVGLTTTFHRADLTGYEKWSASAELMCMNPAWQQKDLAELLHLDPSQVTRLLSPSKCSGDWQEALKAGKVTISDCYTASKLDAAAQTGLLALRLSGEVSGREGMERQARKKRNSGAAVVRANRLRIDLVTGTTVTVTGADLSLDDAIEATKEAMKEMTKGRDLGLDCKTIQAVARDKAKAG